MRTSRRRRTGLVTVRPKAALIPLASMFRSVLVDLGGRFGRTVVVVLAVGAWLPAGAVVAGSPGPRWWGRWGPGSRAVESVPAVHDEVGPGPVGG